MDHPRDLEGSPQHSSEGRDLQSLARFPEENPYPILRLSADGILLYANPASQQLIDAWGCQVGSSANEFWQTLARDISQSRTRRSIDLDCLDRSYSFDVVPVPGTSYINLYGRDVTEQRQTERILSHYRLLFEHSLDICLFLRLSDGRILEANKAAEQAYGYTRDELLSLVVTDIRLPGEEAAIRKQMQTANRTGIRFETWHRRKDQSIFPVEISSLGAVLEGERINLSIVRDISERHKAEAERGKLLKENLRQAALLDAIFEADPAGLAVLIGDALSFAYVNPAYRMISMRPGADLIGQSYSTVWPDDPGALQSRIQQALQTGQPFMISGMERMYPDSTLCTYTVQARRVAWDGEPAVLLIYWDTTNLTQAQNLLRENEEKFRTTLASIGDAVITTDQLGNTTYLNPVAEQLTGWKNQEAVGHSLERIFPIFNELTRKPAHNPVKIVLDKGKTVGLANHTVLIAKGGERVIPIEDSAAPIKNATGQTTGVVMVFHDVTEKRHAELALKESEERYRTLFTSLNEGFALHEIILDEAGQPVDYRFLDLNPAFEKQTGLIRDEVVGRTVREVIPGIEAYWIDTYGQVALTGKPAHFINHAESLGRTYEVIAYRPAPGQFAVLFVDITQQRRSDGSEEQGS